MFVEWIIGLFSIPVIFVFVILKLYSKNSHFSSEDTTIIILGMFLSLIPFFGIGVLVITISLIVWGLSNVLGEELKTFLNSKRK